MLVLLSPFQEAAAAVVIQNVNVTITPPVAGETPSASAQVAADGCSVSRVTWKDETESSFLDESSSFASSHRYQVIINLVAGSGYAFDSSTTDTLNGVPTGGGYRPGIGAYQISYTFPAVLTPIESIIWMNMDTPMENEYPRYNPTLLDALGRYSLKSVIWEDTSTHTILNGLTDTFISGHSYKVSIRLTPGDGYYFSTEADGRICGNMASFVRMANGEGLFEYEFYSPLISINKIVVYLDRLPEAGQVPSMNFSVPSGSHYELDLDHPAQWYDVDDYYLVFDIFEAGHTYGVSVPLIPHEGYFFAKDVPFFVNDIKGTRIDGTFSCDFPVVQERGGWQKIDGKWYYYQNGSTVTGWQKISNQWYYFSSSGIMQSGWIKLDGKWYYLGNEMKTGWQKISNQWYYFNDKGVMQSGWIQLGGKWYYLNNEMKTSWQKISSKWYYFSNDGVMQTGWILAGGKWYYLNSEMKTSWQKISNQWYYFDGSGMMQRGWIQLGGKWYYLNSEMKTGWQKISNKWYYFNSDGVMQIGWIQIDSKWYYLGTNGAMITGTQVIGGKTYVFDSNGVWQK